MERKLFYADAFPHHETCGCKSCISENEGTSTMQREQDHQKSLSEKGREGSNEMQKGKQR
jgi:hypothetical protein